MPIAPWRLRLQPASFNNVQFHVDAQSRNSGRRIALHEFPKRDIPWAEDMGRRAKRFPIIGYIIGINYTALRDQLVVQLEKEGPGILILPTGLTDDNDTKTVVCESFTVTERREQGGYCVFEMNFVESGSDIASQTTPDTQAAVKDASTNAMGVSVQQVAAQNALPGMSIDPTTMTAFLSGNPLATAALFAIAGGFQRSSDITLLNPAPPW